MKQGAGVRRLLTVVLVVVAFGFLVWTAAGNWQDLRTYEWQVDPVLLGLSLIAHVAVLVWGVLVWSRVLSCFPRVDVRIHQLLRIWFLSSAARYIPGKVWQFVAAAQLAKGAGLSAALLLTSLMVHTGFALLAAGVVAAATLPGATLGLGAFPWWAPLTVALIIAIALSHPAVLRALLGAIPRALHRDVVGWEGSWRDGVQLLVLSGMSWLFYGVAFYLFVASLTPLESGSLIPLTGVNALAFLAGYAVLLAPAGLGVREAAMTVLLSPFVPGGVGAVIAILSRLWTIAAELCGAIPALILGRSKPAR
ncbi:MAG TPA: lysylphosphatidylglycerol synthase domain-containing protein [Longimicrobiaceae bacterium]|nr:lysylphosphatidylglycerol synthase domain-containing protein [Longimicrobiaceae bacterium]